MDGASTTGTAASEPRSVDGGQGVTWWTDAWALFTKNPVMWIVLGLLLIIAMVLSQLTLIVSVLLTLTFPIFIGSWMLATRKAEGGGALAVGDLFTCFGGDKLKPLLVLGAASLGFLVVMVVVAVVLGMGAIFSAGIGRGPVSAGAVLAALSAGMLALLAVLLIAVVAVMALWFAPALVVFRGTAPMDAMRASFAASLKNVVPFTLFGLISLLATVVALIPLFLGLLVLMPVGMLTLYTSYKDVFES